MFTVSVLNMNVKDCKYFVFGFVSGQAFYFKSLYKQHADRA